MPLYQAIVLAIVQGLTEFLPISSTAHLTLFPWFLHWQDPGLTFDVALHVGTLIAVFFYFWRMWLDMVMAAAGRRSGSAPNPEVQHQRMLFWFLVAGTIPGGIAGYLFEHAAETRFREPVVIGTALIVVALIMWAGERMQEDVITAVSRVSLPDSLVIGVAQAFAVIPGVSRSGITMAAGLFRSMTRETAARFSFLLSTPLIAGAALKKALEIRHEGLAPDMRLPFLVGIIVSAVVGYLVIAALLRFLEHRTFKPFIIYRIALGVAVLAHAAKWI
ncbi:MAG TPA: undecaprenyl-diphosphate phosphatase [Terriglobia bacterium]|nr:undecaprenyl-diphosphate phosphatase [Terriglobia bacterium]